MSARRSRIVERYGKGVVALTVIDRLGVSYEVKCLDDVVWSCSVRFKNQGMNRPGGKAFQAAAQEQERQAKLSLV